MQNFTVTDLERLLSCYADVSEAADLNGAILDTEFAELGYDSLALLELVSRVQREYGVFMPDDAPQQMTTPRGAISYVNAQLAAATGRPVGEGT